MKINEDFVPSTINETIEYLYNSLSREDKEFIKNEESPSSIHFTVGMDLRNAFSFWEEDTPIHIDFKNRFELFGHADDLSGIILEGLWAKVKGKNIEETLNNCAQKYKKHWEKLGINPTTGEYYDKSSKYF